MRQLLTDLRTGRPVRPSIRGWWARESKGILVGVAVVAFGWLGWQQVQLSEYNSQRRADRAANIQAVCQAINETTAYNKQFVEQFHVTYAGPRLLACAPLVARARRGGP